MLGQKGAELVNELARNKYTIPSYNEELVRELVEETKVLFESNHADVNEIMQQEPGSEQLGNTVTVRHQAIERNKRCLTAYHHERLQRLKKYRWQTGAILPPDVRNSISESEFAWFQQYSEMLAKYMESLGEHGGVDIADYQVPPKSLFVEVKCLEDYGVLETADGVSADLSKGSIHLLPRIDVEPLIRSGVLEPID